MLKNQNNSLEDALKLINSHKIKSNSLKNFYLRNISNDESVSEILGYLRELEYDLETLNKLITNFQIYYSNFIDKINNSCFNGCNLNSEINRLNNELTRAKNEIINLKSENNFLKNKDNRNKIISNDKMRKNNDVNNKKLNKTCYEMDNYGTCLNYNLCNTTYKNNLIEPKNGLDNKFSGRLTYQRNSNSNEPNDIESNNINKPKKIINQNKANKINNKKKNSNSINKSIYNINNNMNKDIINILDNNVNKNSNINNSNRNINNVIRNNINNNNSNINNYINNNNKLNNNMYNNLNFRNNLNLNNNNNINENNYLFENINPIDSKNYSSNNIPNSNNSIMNSKRIIPKYHYEIKSFNKKISEIPKEKDNKINRINNIISVISSDENKLNELKAIFGNNIDSQLLNGDINDEYLDKIENTLYNMGRNKSIIPLSKRFQIQYRAKSNSARKPKNFLNHNKRQRLISQKLSEKKNKNNKNKWNINKDFYINNSNNFISN